MSGSGLVQCVVNIIALLAAGGIFFLSIDKVAPDALAKAVESAVAPLRAELAAAKDDLAKLKAQPVLHPRCEA